MLFYCLMLPIFDEIYKRSAKFILSCLCSGSALVRIYTIINYGILAHSDSFIGRNIMFLSSRYHFSVVDFKAGLASHLNTITLFHLTPGHCI